MLREEIFKRGESSLLAFPLKSRGSQGYGSSTLVRPTRSAFLRPTRSVKIERNEDEILEGGIHYVRKKRDIPPGLCAGT